MKQPPEADSGWTPGSFWQRYAKAAPPIALLAPAYNEALTVVESVRSLLSIRYPDFEIVVINDGSIDQTLQILIDTFQLELTQSRDYDLVVEHRPIRGLYVTRLHPRLLVIDKENGGKADALNAGINLATAPVVCSMDADSVLEPDSLLRAVQPFLEDPQRVIAVGGTIRVANGCDIADGRIVKIGAPRNLLALMQTVEYLRAFLMARLAWSQIDALTIISGAFGLFRRQAVLEVGGYAHGTVGEDMELVVRLHRHFRDAKKPYRIAFVPEPVCWTEAPESLKVLSRQRARWHRGALETFGRHRAMAFNPKYGAVGMVGFGWIVLSDVIGPPTEMLGYVLIPIWAFARRAVAQLPVRLHRRHLRLRRRAERRRLGARGIGTAPVSSRAGPRRAHRRGDPGELWLPSAQPAVAAARHAGLAARVAKLGRDDAQGVQVGMTRGRLVALIGVGVVLLAIAAAAGGLWFKEANAFYRFDGVSGPPGQSAVATATPARIADFDRGGPHRLAVLVTDPIRIGWAWRARSGPRAFPSPSPRMRSARCSTRWCWSIQ
ncbi:MAG: glycosyltransferase family 2 protein [Caulobacteraceae bacterium]